MIKKACRLLLLAVVLAPLPVFGQPEAIEVDFVNGVYTNLDGAIQPVERGGLTIHVQSPEHRLVVHRNRLWLSANGDGSLDATFEVEFEGEGHIIARLETGGVSNSFEDQVTAPRQTVSVSGKARLQRIEEGYLMTVVEAPPSVDLEIRSDLAGRLVSLCRAVEALIPVSCGGIDTALSVVTAPLPQAGEQFVVAHENLTADERAYFDRFAR